MKLFGILSKNWKLSELSTLKAPFCNAPCLLLQASKFVIRFHQERRTKLSFILDSERWRQADVPAEFQALVSRIHSTGMFERLTFVIF